MMSPLRQEGIPARIAKLQQVGAPRWPLYEAAGRRIDYFEVPLASAGTCAGSFKRWAAGSAGHPAIVLLGDDDDFQGHAGPDHWPIARRAMRWAAFVLIHGAAGYPDQYRWAIELAKLHRRLLVIECRSATIPAWKAAAACWAAPAARALVLEPPPGCQHPTPPAREKWH